MRIILADPPNKGGWRVSNHPNLGVLYLSGYLKRSFPGLQVCYLDQHLPLDEHLRRVEAFKPDLYGMSFATLWAEEAEEAMAGVRARFADVPIVCGGAHPSAAPERVVRMTGVDACAIGEGEATMADLVRHFLLEEMTLSDVDGIAYADDGRMVVTRARRPFHNLDELPMPDWDLVDLTSYQGNYQYKASPSTAMITTRGCAFDCNFCSNPVWNTSKPFVRMRGPESICEEVKYLYGRGIRDIYIRSDEANVNTRWFMETCQAIKHLGLKDLYFQCNLRADHVTDESARLYAESGGWLIYLGIESGNARTLKGIGKHVTLEGIERTCRLMKKYGVDVFGLFMMYHLWEEKGELCNETYADVQNTLGFIRRLRREKLLDYISFTTTTPMPGSRLWHTAIKYDLIDPSIPIKDLSAFTMRLPGVSVWDMKKSRIQGMLIQLWLVLRSGNTVWSDLGKLKIKLKYLVESLIPGKSTFSGPFSAKDGRSGAGTDGSEGLGLLADPEVPRYGKRKLAAPKSVTRSVVEVLRGERAY